MSSLNQEELKEDIRIFWEMIWYEPTFKLSFFQKIINEERDIAPDSPKSYHLMKILQEFFQANKEVILDPIK